LFEGIIERRYRARETGELSSVNLDDGIKHGGDNKSGMASAGIDELRISKCEVNNL
jgi:hypothetical protein